ncbi:MAG: ribosome recycling factor [Candidatus Firestonebacteria bacterium]
MPFAINAVEDKMKKAIEHVSKELMSIRTGRASTAIFDNIKAEYFGSEVPLKQLANIIVQARTIEIKPFDASAISNIEKAIQKSDLGLTPVSDGKVVRLNIPPLTEDRRKELVKYAKKLCEDGKVTCRNNRRDANDELEKMKKSAQMSEDDNKRNKDAVQKMLDRYIAEIDKLLSNKEKEIMEV